MGAGHAAGEAITQVIGLAEVGTRMEIDAGNRLHREIAVCQPQSGANARPGYAISGRRRLCVGLSAKHGRQSAEGKGPEKQVCHSNVDRPSSTKTSIDYQQ